MKKVFSAVIMLCLFNGCSRASNMFAGKEPIDTASTVSPDESLSFSEMTDEATEPFIEDLEEVQPLALRPSGGKRLIFPPIVDNFLGSLPEPKNLCTPEERARILARRSKTDATVNLKCSLELKRDEFITKSIFISGDEGSNVSINCKGGAIGKAEGPRSSIIIESVETSSSNWSRPKGVVIRNCRIFGYIRVTGMAINGEGAKLRESSDSFGHTVRARRAAPTQILLRNNVIIARNSIPIYLSPGATYVAVLNSKLRGSSRSVAAYLDAESGYNIFFNNFIAVNSSKREQVAIDASSHNYFANNRFSHLDTGGIFLYRNCGEGGTARHQTPSHNILLNNTFYYAKYDGDKPAIFLSSRNGNRDYCNDDAGIKLGSGSTNSDHAQFNVVAANQIYKLSVEKMIRRHSGPNFLFQNQTVAKHISRQPGCVVHTIGGRRYIPYGEQIEGKTCVGEILPLERKESIRVPFRCSREGNSNGCSREIQCPSEKELVAVRAVCNLETKVLPDPEYSTLEWNEIRVARTSDHRSQGVCSLNGINIHSGQTSTISLNRSQVIQYRCRETDQNGGDCIVRGELLCQ